MTATEPIFKSALRNRSGLKAALQPGLADSDPASMWGAGPGGITAGELVRQTNRWRENYNPLRGLILRKAVGLLEAGERGEFADLQWLYRMVEKRYAVLRSLITRRRSSIMKLEWDVKVMQSLPINLPPEAPEATVKAATAVMEAKGKIQREYLKSRYDLIGNLKQAIGFLELAEFRGFSILNKHRHVGGPNDGAVKELHWLPQWNFVRDGIFGDWYWNADAASGATFRSLGEANRLDITGESPESRAQSPESGNGEACPTYRDFMFRETDMPINEIGLIAFIRSNLSHKDWDAFVEIFGLAGCVVIMPGNIPQGKEAEYQAAAEKIAEGGSGALPAGGDAKFPSSAVRGNSPFKEHLDYQEKDVVLAGTGGKLTMLTGPTGLGGGQAETHDKAFDEIATAAAGDISETFQKQFDRPELAAQFPGEPALAYFQLTPTDETAAARLDFKRKVWNGFQTDGTVADVLANQTDLKQLTKDVELPVNEEYTDPYLPVQDNAGGTISGETVKDSEGDVIGAQVEAPTATVQAPGNNPSSNGRPGTSNIQHRTPNIERGNPVLNRQQASKLEEAGRHLVAKAVAADLEPIRQRLQLIMQIEDPEIFHKKAVALIGEIDRLKGDILQDPQAAQALAETLSAALATGLTQKR